MAFLGLVDTKEVEAFATTLAEDLGRRFPPASEKRTDAGAKNQLGVILEGLATRAVRFQPLVPGVSRRQRFGVLISTPWVWLRLSAAGVVCCCDTRTSCVGFRPDL